MEIAESTTEKIASANSQTDTGEAKPKRTFVVPEISAPVDVLEATTYFQVAASGGTNP